MKCKECEIETKNPKFCSRSCSVKYNNRGRNRHGTEVGNCLNCENKLGRLSKKFCSHKCHKHYDWAQRKILIESGDATMPHRQYKRYLTEVRGHQCEICGISEWCGKELPMVMDHIDGNSENNKLDNLRLVCSNCDSQLPTWKNRNKGKGRHKRRQRYAEGRSY